jgi:hypothetical protein
VCFYDWADGRMVRRIDVAAKDVHWSENSEMVAIVAEQSFYILRCGGLGVWGPRALCSLFGRGAGSRGSCVCRWYVWGGDQSTVQLLPHLLSGQQGCRHCTGGSRAQACPRPAVLRVAKTQPPPQVQPGRRGGRICQRAGHGRGRHRGRV